MFEAIHNKCLFLSHGNCDAPGYYLKDVNLDNVDYHKDLGVIVDNHCLFKQHVSYICDVTDGDFVYIYSAICNCLGVYFIGRSGTGPWAQVRRFRLLRSTTVSRAFGEFEGESHLLTCWRVTDMFQRASVHSIDRGCLWTRE